MSRNYPSTCNRISIGDGRVATVHTKEPRYQQRIEDAVQDWDDLTNSGLVGNGRDRYLILVSNLKPLSVQGPTDLVGFF